MVFIVTDSKGDPVEVIMDTPTSPNTKMATITHVPPHKAAALASQKRVLKDASSKQSVTLNVDPVASEGEADQKSEPLKTSSLITACNNGRNRRGSPPKHSIPLRFKESIPKEPDVEIPVANLKPDADSLSPVRSKASPPVIPPQVAQKTTTSPKVARLSIDLASLPPTPITPATFRRQAIKNSKSPVIPQNNALLAYNQYGEIIKIKDMNKPHDPSSLTVTQTLRLIDTVYGYEFRTRMAKVIEIQMEERTYPADEDDEEKPPLIRSLSSWDYLGFPVSPCVGTPDGAQVTLVYTGPPRVLEIGCGNGSWCFASKYRHQDWIIEGIDDADHWTEARPDLTFRNFTTPPSESQYSPVDYFKGFQLSQEHPEFTVRNLNALLAHQDPIPHNLYGLIRGRDVFDRIESYKEFLEDVRLVLQPDGVLEFVELDPRPRADFMGGESLTYTRGKSDAHTSGPETDWTDKIIDRFKNPKCDELATTVNGWSERVAERLKATLRPKDGVPAPQLKSLLEGAGFWDVKEIVFRLQVGGETRGGKLLLEVIQHRIKLENDIPLLARDLPAVETAALESGEFFLGLHIVTGRKPKYPRPGDLLLDGTRMEMTHSKYDAMAKLNDAKSNQWKRFDLDGKLTSMMKTLGAIHGSESTTPISGSPRKPQSTKTNDSSNEA